MPGRKGALKVVRLFWGEPEDEWPRIAEPDDSRSGVSSRYEADPCGLVGGLIGIVPLPDCPLLEILSAELVLRVDGSFNKSEFLFLCPNSCLESNPLPSLIKLGELLS